MDLSPWTHGIAFGRGLRTDVGAFLLGHNRPGTLAHVEQVAVEAIGLAKRYQSDPTAAEQAALLHDISAVIPNAQRLEIARQWDLAVLEEEETYPMLLHQRLSAVLAREVFGVGDENVLSAVGCHTTLRPASSLLDRVVFVADKLAWDQVGQPPYLPGLLAALQVSLDQGACFYLHYLHQHATGSLHPWARLALRELQGAV